MLFKPRPQRDVVVLDDEDRRHMKDSGEVDAFMECGGFCGAVSDPCKHHSLFTTLFDGESHACKYGSQRRDLAGRCNHAFSHTADMEILAFARRVGCGE